MAETKDQRERREKLANILENDEMLIWFSGARNEVRECPVAAGARVTVKTHC